MTVKLFRSTDFGAPALTNAAGAFIAVLDACLLNGYGLQTVTITRTAGIATVTTPVAHTLKDGTFIRIAGATQPEYNGDFAITVINGTSFSYPVLNSPVSPATGTITAKVAPADWTKPFSGTNLAAYKTGAGSNGMFLRVDDSMVSTGGITGGITSDPIVSAYENMTDIMTGTGLFSSGRAPQKAANASATWWYVLATEKMLYVASSNQSYQCVMAFGDFVTKRQGDAFNTIACFASAHHSPEFYVLSNSNANLTYHDVARNYTQIGGQCVVGFRSEGWQTTFGMNGYAYPCPLDGALYLSDITITEGASGVRGTMPGLWNIMHHYAFNTGDIIIGTGDFTGKRFLVMNLQQGQCALEISDTW